MLGKWTTCLVWIMSLVDPLPLRWLNVRLLIACRKGFGRAKPVHGEYLFGRRGFVDEALLVQ